MDRGTRMTEEDVKLRYITPAIQRTGWPDAQIRMEHCFTDGQVLVQDKRVTRGQRKKADYLLIRRGSGMPLAVVEAKAPDHGPGDGMQQAIGYAEALGAPFAYSSNGDGFVEHDLLIGRERSLTMDQFPGEEELWARYIAAKDLAPEQEAIVSQPYHVDLSSEKSRKREPRYYQRRAIDLTVEAVARGRRRLLLVMATGTGKTFTAFQIVWRLRQAGRARRVLYLADRNILVDQPMRQDFKPLAKVMTKVQHGHLDSSYEVYMCLYQQLIGDRDDPEKPYMAFRPEFFDLVIVDECHRGSAAEDSQWRTILDWFSPAVHIGMTATPRETGDVSNAAYFGDPIYTYSLKQGIEDGFLAPYKVIRVGLDTDLMGWRPEAGQTDVYGRPIPDDEYGLSDFERKLVIPERTEVIAKRVAQWLKENGRYSKTIVFCVDIDHAERMRQALVNENADLVREDPSYVMRVTGDVPDAEERAERFSDVYERYPTVVTTSELLSTGVDTKTVRLIVLVSVINSMTKFKQIVGRGTRIYRNEDDPREDKEYFTIMDFTGACRLFADPDFDGEPAAVVDWPPDQPFPPDPAPIIDGGDPLPPDGPPDGGSGGDGGPVWPPDGPKKIYVRGVEVTVVTERVQYIDPQTGGLITESIRDYSKRNILGQYATLDGFLHAWDATDRKQAILEALREQGVFLDALREEAGPRAREMDDFDLILHVAWDQPPLTKRERVERVKKRGHLHKYSGECQRVLSALMDKYMDSGIGELEDIRVLDVVASGLQATSRGIVKLFGGRDQYLQAVRELARALYEAA